MRAGEDRDPLLALIVPLLVVGRHDEDSLSGQQMGDGRGDCHDRVTLGRSSP